MKAIVFGAGNIGRGFIGQLLCESNINITFVDVAEEIVAAINNRGSYTIHMIDNDSDTPYTVTGISAINGKDFAAVAQAFVDADVAATAVGANALRFIAPAIAEGLLLRAGKPINIIICENLYNADSALRELVREWLPADKWNLLDGVGFTMASIGRMVPVHDRGMDLVDMKVEPYCKLPIDADAIVGSLPNIAHAELRGNFGYYVERKLYIHNFGHAYTAYLGYIKGYTYIYEAICDNEIYGKVRSAMLLSARALSLLHNGDMSELTEHVDDLLLRFNNRKTADTIARVGGDLRRKLAPGDRLVGTLEAVVKAGLPCDEVAAAIAASLRFTLDPLLEIGAERVLTEVCGYCKGNHIYTKIMSYFT